MKIILTGLQNADALWQGELDMSDIYSRHNFSDNNFNLLCYGVMNNNLQSRKLFLRIADEKNRYVHKRAAYISCNEDVILALEIAYLSIVEYKLKFLKRLGT